MNVLFFLTPKASCAYLYSDNTLRQAIEKMENSGYEALPILNRDGTYFGTLSTGDLLRAVHDHCDLNLLKAEDLLITDIPRRRSYQQVSITMDMRTLLRTATQQNFVPVVDDKKAFIGIVTRQAIMRFCLDTYITDSDFTDPTLSRW